MRMNLSQPSHPRLPSAGPIALIIPGVSDVTIAAATVGPEVLFTWPAPYLVSGFWLGEETVADAATIAGLRLRMQDSARNELMADGAGLVDNAPALAFCGRSLRWQPLQRVVRAGHKWLFQIENTNAVDVVPLLYFKLEAE